jgi:hypothetical protein
VLPISGCRREKLLEEVQLATDRETSGVGLEGGR